MAGTNLQEDFSTWKNPFLAAGKVSALRSQFQAYASNPQLSKAWKTRCLGIVKNLQDYPAAYIDEQIVAVEAAIIEKEIADHDPFDDAALVNGIVDGLQEAAK